MCVDAMVLTEGGWEVFVPEKSGTKREPSCMNAQEELSGLGPEVLRGVAEGDLQCFAMLYDAAASRVYAVALKMLGNPEDAEELVQDVFARVWRDAARYDAMKGQPLAWITAMTRHRAIDVIRSRGRRSRLQNEVTAEPVVGKPTGAGDPASQAVCGERAEAVREALAEMKDEAREVLESAYFGGLSHTEVAEALGLPVSTVKARIRKGMEDLRRALRRYR